MHRVTFTNPADASSYVWAVNPGFDAETTPAGKQIAIERTSNTGSVGATKQQGDDGPYILHWEFNVYHASHELAMFVWYALSRKQTIYLTDFNGEQYEGQIITCQRQRIGAMTGPGDTGARGYYLKFVFEFEVWLFLTGVMADAGVRA